VPGAVLSPHIGGPTLDYLPALGLRAGENVRRHLAGEPLIQPITPEVYDRST
jgi:phosphoglycerate dehydrogenase-like enzyme